MEVVMGKSSNYFKRAIFWCPRVCSKSKNIGRFEAPRKITGFEALKFWSFPKP
jgi:hypothetical protein